MKEILDSLNFIRDYIGALSTGIEKFAEVLPIYIKQEFETKSKQKLNSTQSVFMNALRMETVENVMIIELDPNEWLANAVEKGASPFDMREGLLKSPKAKFSRKGFRYMLIPINGNPKATPPPSEKGQEIQAKILEVLSRNKFGKPKTWLMMGGQLRETQKALTDDPDMKGFVRSRMHKSPEAYFSKKSKPKWEYVLFRAISDNPESKSFDGWKHPGIQPANIFPEVQSWMDGNLDRILNDIIERETSAVLDKLKKGTTEGGM